MKKFGKVLPLIAALVIASATAFAGSATSNMAVSASVSANCTISAAPMAFGAYDPIVTNASTALTQSANLAVDCTNGSAATITLGQGANSGTGSTDAAPIRRMANGSNYLNYGLYSDNGDTTTWDNSTGVSYTGTGASDSVTVYGSIPGGQNVSAGSYTDTVVATITF